jgi:non-ribosomal peptide synthetase component F
VHSGADASQFQPQRDQEGENRCFTLTLDLTQRLRAFSKNRQTTVFVCMLTAFNMLLNSCTRYRHVPIGIPVSNRMLYEETELLGCFVNRVTYYEPVSPIDDIDMLLARCRKRMYSILDNQAVPYELLNNDIRAQGWNEKLYAPVCFNYLTAMPVPVNIDDVELHVSAIESSLARVDLMLSVNDEEILRFLFNYHKNIFSEEQIEILSEKYLELLTAMVRPR